MVGDVGGVFAVALVVEVDFFLAVVDVVDAADVGCGGRGGFLRVFLNLNLH